MNAWAIYNFNVDSASLVREAKVFVSLPTVEPSLKLLIGQQWKVQREEMNKMREKKNFIKFKW